MCKLISILFGGAIIFISGVLAQGGGSLKGTITYEGPPVTREELKITKDKAVCGKEPHYDESLLVGENNSLQNVVVSIMNAPKGDLKSLGSEFSLDQLGCAYVPHILIIPVGAPLQILNSDGILHNIHTHSQKNQPFNVSQPKYKKKVKKTFEVPETIPAKCDVHGWMSGYIVVVDHPYYGVSGEAGEYEISGIPPGTYRVEFWHEKLGKMQKDVTVEAGGTAKLDLVFKASAE